MIGDVFTGAGRVGFADPTPLEIELLDVPGKLYDPPSRAAPDRRGLFVRELAGLG